VTTILIYHGAEGLKRERIAVMDITSFAIGNRESALLIGDYSTYRSQLSRKLLAIRKRLGRATPKNAKFQQKPPVTAEDIKKNNE